MKFSKEHEWVYLKKNQCRVGITDFAQNELGEVVFIELPSIGSHFNVGDEIAVVESVKAASEIYAPVQGKITAVNSDLIDSPQLINDDPYEAGWMFELEVNDINFVNSLMNEEEYKQFINSIS